MSPKHNTPGSRPHLPEAASETPLAGRASLPGPDDVLRRRLPNGITVLLRENFASPAVVVNGYLHVGAEDEPHELRGLAGFVTDTMERGTQRRSFNELYEATESIGAGFGLNSGTHITSFGAKGLADSLPLLLDILSDVLRNPAFDPQQVEKARTEILTDIQERTHDTGRMARLRFYELAYPEAHPYHWSQTGYLETVARIKREDLIAFHERYYTPENMVIVVVGGIEAEAAFEVVRDAFGDWSQTRPPREPLPEVPPLDARRSDHVILAEKSQTSLCLGWPGPPRTHQDFIPCFVTNTVLGIFGMYGRLGQRVREENGLAYYVYSRLDGGAGPGPWRVLAGFDPAKVEQGTQLIVEELHRIREEIVPDDELNDSQSYLTGSLPLHLETNEGVARSLVSIERYGLGLDYLQRYPAMIRKVTPADVQRVAQRWLDPDHYALVTAGRDTATENEG